MRQLLIKLLPPNQAWDICLEVFQPKLFFHRVFVKAGHLLSLLPHCSICKQAYSYEPVLIQPGVGWASLVETQFDLEMIEKKSGFKNIRLRAGMFVEGILSCP